MKTSLAFKALRFAVLALTFGLINPFNGFLVGMAAYPSISGSTKSQIITASPEGEEIIWEHEVIQAAAQQSPFADNMTGGMGSGKPIVIKNNTKIVAGQSIVISTVDSLGAPITQGNGVRVGNEEQVKPGDFLLKTSLGWIGAGIDNTGLTQTIIGQDWDNLSKQLISRRLAKQQSDDALTCLKHSAVSSNTVYPVGKTIDTLSSSDKYSTALIVRSNGSLKDIGATPINARPNPDNPSAMPPPINRYMQFLTDAGARPIKLDSNYLQGMQLAKDRGDKNNLFTGDYSDWDNNIIYPWVNIRHGGYGPIGSALQPEALLGTSIVAKGTSTTVGTLDGGGSAANAAITPLRNYFENFSRFTYTPINGVTTSYTPRSTYGYCAVIDATTGAWSFFRYTGNTGNTLTGVKRLGSSATGDYLTTLGDVTWGTAPYLTTADGNGFQGVSEGVIASGSLIYETNSKGVPLCFGLGLGEMALVAGYGKVPINGGASFKTMANRTMYQAPHGQAVANGLEVAWGCAAFKRPDGVTPNYVLEVFAREVAGFPNIA